MNSKLYNKIYNVPSDVLKGIQVSLVSNPHGNGVKRAKNILRSGKLTYQAMKRIKNFFDTFNGDGDEDQAQYALAGGDAMRQFINSALGADRDAVETSKERRQDMNLGVNQITKAHTPAQAPELNEEKKELDKNAVAVIVN